MGAVLTAVNGVRQEKTAALEAPLGDIFNTPFLIVIGTASPDAAMRAYCQRYARRNYLVADVSAGDAARRVRYPGQRRGHRVLFAAAGGRSGGESAHA